jgi:hypothetical protein
MPLFFNILEKSLSNFPNECSILQEYLVYLFMNSRLDELYEFGKNIDINNLDRERDDVVVDHDKNDSKKLLSLYIQIGKIHKYMDSVNINKAVNLLNIYSALSNEDIIKVVEKFEGRQFSDFKKELNEIAVEILAPITKEMRKLLEDKTYLTGIIKDGGNRANIIAQPIITKVKDIVGLY